ncbi:hypothetical protein [Ancylobacter sp.]|uniref:hypothetical protein n=1 Tax=Ancylobacter sp. TaxID=1872567 RepID=UPI003C7B712B
MAKSKQHSSGSKRDIPLHPHVLNEAPVKDAAESSKTSTIMRLTKRPSIGEPTTNLNLRPPISLSNRFVSFSIEQRMTYNEALADLMDRAGVDENGNVADRRGAE